MPTLTKIPVDMERQVFDYVGTGSPTTVLANAPAGATYRQIDGGSGSMLWQKTTAGWEAIGPAGPPTWASITGKPTTIAGYGITDFNSLGDARWARLAAANSFSAVNTFGAAINITANTGVPAATGTTLWVASGFGSPNIGRVFIGDGTGWQLTFAKRTGSVTTDVAIFSDAGGLTLLGSLATERVVGVTRAAINKGFFGIATSAGDIIVGSATDDIAIRAVTSGARILFSLDNGASASWILADGFAQAKPTTGTNASYLHFVNTGGDYYIGVDNSAAGAFGFGAYGFGLYTPAGVAWYVNKTSNVMSFTQIPFVAVSGVTARPVASYVISTVAPTTETAPEGTIWIQT